MMDAGIDVVLPVFWGEPAQRLPNEPVSAQPWSFSGIPPLVQAREDLLGEGRRPPTIGLFYDTSTLQYNNSGKRIDLTTDYGRQWFYETVRDFFSLVPPKHWAMIGGKPIVFLYASSFAANYDQSCIGHLRTSFGRDFGGRTPFTIREISWQVQTENVYAWGGALGLKNPGVASLGPGYDHSAVPGRVPLIVPREGGAFFQSNWLRFLNRPSKLVMIETWNEYHEGTDIAASREYGRQYIGLNRKFVDLFKRGYRPPRPRGAYSDAKTVSVTLRATNLVEGLQQLEEPDGLTSASEAGGSDCRTAITNVYGGRYIYFRLDESFRWADLMSVDVEVEYFDTASGTFRIEYDGSDPKAPFQGAYTGSKLTIRLTGQNIWKTARFRLIESRFLNSQNGGADFRIAVEANPFFVRRVRVIRPGLPNEAGQTLRGFQQDFALPLGTNWTVRPEGSLAFQEGNGMLRVVSDSIIPRSALLAVAAGDGPDQEILGRLRVVSAGAPGSGLGGIASGMNLDSLDGIECSLSRSAQDERQLSLSGAKLPEGPRSAYAWKPNIWYWLRVRHATNAATSSPDVLAKMWPADGEAPEPDLWLSGWDYYPASSMRQGLAGLVAGTGGADLDFDFFLIKSAMLPEITVRLPAPKPARAGLSPLGYSTVGGFRLALAGQPDTAYLIQASTNLIDWSDTTTPPAFLTTDALGAATLVDPEGVGLPGRFYRARLAQSDLAPGEP
jgi:hypothetical protein